MSEAVSFETGIAALAYLLDQPYELVSYDSAEVGDENVHHIVGFGGREVHLRSEGDVHTAEVAFFRRFECKLYEDKGERLSLDAALALKEEMLRRIKLSV